MKLTDFDLRQMDEKYLSGRTLDELKEISNRLLEDLKEARDRLNRTPDNSSRPPSSRAPWESSAVEQGPNEVPDRVEDEGEPAQGKDGPPAQDKPAAPTTTKSPTSVKRRPGKQPGTPGHGRTQRIKAIAHEQHRPELCASCGAGLSSAMPSTAYTGYDEIDLAEREPAELGMRLICTRHTLYAVTCSCAHQTRAQAYRADDEALWEAVELSQWRLVGPRLAALIVYFGLRMRLSHERIKELLWELFGLALCKGTIGQTIREAGRAAEPLLDEIADEVQSAQLLHVDETSWPEGGQKLWLWVLVSSMAVLYAIGSRGKDMIDAILGQGFKGTLMTDGYCAYRDFAHRLRCWAHLSRKLRGLAESTDARVARTGRTLEKLFLELQGAIYAARADPAAGPPNVTHASEIDRLKAVCQQHRDDPHNGVRALAREFLLDWDVIVRQLAEPHLPLTNNESERMLRHWVIARRLSHGTRTPSGSRAFSVLASVIETCRRRRACSLTVLATTIAHARRGVPPPSLPCPVSF
jgi:hypothetical protein